MKSTYILSIYRNDGQHSIIGTVKNISSEEAKTFKTSEELEGIIREIVSETQD